MATSHSSSHSDIASWRLFAELVSGGGLLVALALGAALIVGLPAALVLWWLS